MKRFLTMLFVVGLFSLIPVTTWALSGFDINFTVKNNTSGSVLVKSADVSQQPVAYVTDVISQNIPVGTTHNFHLENGINDDGGYFIMFIVPNYSPVIIAYYSSLDVYNTYAEAKEAGETKVKGLFKDAVNVLQCGGASEYQTIINSNPNRYWNPCSMLVAFPKNSSITLEGISCEYKIPAGGFHCWIETHCDFTVNPKN